MGGVGVGVGVGGEMGPGGGPDVLLLAHDVLVDLGQEDGHLVVHVVVLLHHPTALLTAAETIHLWAGNGDHTMTNSILKHMISMHVT